MKHSKKYYSTVSLLIITVSLLLCPLSASAAQNDSVVVQDDNGGIIVITPLSDLEILHLIEQAEQVQPLLDNEVSAVPVRIDANNVGVDFTNNGFILDFVDYVETNLIIWHAEDNNPVGYRIGYLKLPHGTHRGAVKYVANWHSAQTIGGYYVDGFGLEIGIGGASGILYNN